MDKDLMQKARLEDILNYDVETYLRPEEMTLIKNTFRDNPLLLRVLRKVLLPSIGDLDLPPEEIGKDLWLTGVNWEQVTEQEAKPIALGKQLAIKYVMGALINLKMIANDKTETPQQKAMRETKDSSK